MSCATGTFSVSRRRGRGRGPERRDDDCDGRVDECNASQIGQTFACTAAVGICPSVSGSRTCTTVEAPPGACVLVGGGDPNVCQVDCATTINVSTVPELREAVAQAHLTECKDVIVLAPGFYDLDSPLLINDSMEIGASVRASAARASTSNRSCSPISSIITSVRCAATATTAKTPGRRLSATSRNCLAAPERAPARDRHRLGLVHGHHERQLHRSPGGHATPPDDLRRHHQHRRE